MGSRAGALHPPTTLLPFPQLYGGQCWVVLWSLPGLSVLAREYKRRVWGSACPTLGPHTAFLTDPSPHLPHSTLGGGTGGGSPWVGGWLCLPPAHSRWFLFE